MKLLEVKNMTKIFSLEKMESKILNNISFDIKKGDFVTIMGQSGSGKSTLLYNISGMDKMTSGKVFLEGVDVSSYDQEDWAQLRLKTMGFVFQNNYLLKNLNIIDNICLPAFKLKRQSNKDIIKKAKVLMKKMDILDIANNPIQKVSGGQLQRAAVCRALINDPQILFADEPTGALNSRSSQDVIKILKQLNQEGMTILVVSHDPKVASSTERIIYLKDGRIEASLELDKCSNYDDKRQREEATMNWLIEQGF